MKIKQKLGLCGVIILSYFIFRSIGLIETPESWYHYAPANAGFSVRLPGAPRNSQIPLPLAGKESALEIGTVSFLNTAYVMGHAALPETPSQNVTKNEILRQNFIPLQNEGYTLIIEDTTPVEGHMSIYSAWLSPDGAYKMLSQNILTPTHLFCLSTATPSENLASEQEHITHFFKSFQLKDLP